MNRGGPPGGMPPPGGGMQPPGMQQGGMQPPGMQGNMPPPGGTNPNPDPDPDPYPYPDQRNTIPNTSPASTRWDDGRRHARWNAAVGRPATWYATRRNAAGRDFLQGPKAARIT